MSENGKKLWCLAKSWKGLVALAVSIPAFYGAAAAMGVDLPRVAWLHEVQMVDSKADKNTIGILENSQRNYSAERRAIEREKKQLEKRGKVPDQRLIKDHDDVNETLRNINARLKRLRGY